VPTIDDFLKKAKDKKFSKSSEDNWKVDVSPPQIDKRRRPGRRPHLQPADDSPSPPAEADPAKASEKPQPETTVDKSVPNRRQKKKQPETNRRQLETTTVDNRRQKSDQPETKAKQPETTTVDNRRQKAKQPETKPLSAPEAQPVTEETPPPAPSDGLDQAEKQVVYGSEAERLRLKDGLSTVDQDLSPVLSTVKSPEVDISQGLSPVVSGSEEVCLQLQPETTTVDNRRQKRKLPTSRQQLLILQFLADKQIQLGVDHSPRYKSFELAEEVGISWKGMKKQISRLVRAGYLFRLDSKDGRGDAGTVYRVPLPVVAQLSNRLNRRQQPETTVDNNRRQQPETNALVSSSLINTTTTDETGSVEKSLADRFQTTVQKLGIDERGIGANDLLEVWRGGGVNDVDELLMSLEHLAFYIDSPGGQGIDHPKAWIMKQLRKGYYPAPAGYKSWEERQEEAKLEDARKRQERVRELRKQRFEAEYEIWEAELSDERRKALAPNVTPGTHAEKALLRDAFAKESGFVVQEG